ncbi:DEKNAAC102865 [Brettanomyces naardenensis]|uniref:DEKNAAC102865 n=1 Tax=Brettanomyces naardenensis TaxID=13370 RepID=A0A448YLS8_BRENA|nr:DEKNAAC102865 [Brettanomyces naardenensis]
MRSSRQRMGSPVRSPSPVKRPFTFGGGPSLAVPLSSPLPKPSRRRGHHYKHSSVSMNMFQQPDRAADQTNKELPQYPVPSISSVLSSVTTPQRLRLAWCVFQLSLAPICYALGFHYGNICLSTLSHVVFYDAFGNILSVVVMILTNFDVWKSSSLKYPFGLGRIEVLVGFGLSVSLVFVGIDLLSHVIEEFIIALAVDSAGVDSMNSEEAEAAAVALSHHVHETTGGTQLNPLLYEALICLVVLVSLLSSSIVRGKRDEDDEDNVRTDGIFLPGKRSIVSAKRLSSITLEAPKKHSILHHLSSTRNGVNACTTALTLIYSAYSLLYPLIHATNSIEVLNEASTVALSLLILTFGYRLIDRLGNTLLLKSPPESVKQMILKNIQQLDVYRPDYKVEEFLISRVNHKIFIIVLRLVMPGASDDDEAKFRFYAARIIRSLMYRSMNGELDGPEKVDRKSLVALLNLDAAFDTMDESGEQFEITIDIAT